MKSGDLQKAKKSMSTHKSTEKSVGNSVQGFWGTDV